MYHYGATCQKIAVSLTIVAVVVAKNPPLTNVCDCFHTYTVMMTPDEGFGGAGLAGLASF